MVQGLQKYLAILFWVDFGSDFKQTPCCNCPHLSICMESYFSFNAFSFQILHSLRAFYYLSELRMISAMPILSYTSVGESEILRTSGSGPTALVMCFRLLSVCLWVTRWPFPFSLSIKSMLLHGMVLQGCVLESSNDASIHFINASESLADQLQSS